MTRAGDPIRLRPVASFVALALVLTTGVARGAPSLGGVMAHSRDDIPGGFTTLSGNDVTANASLPFAVVIGGVSYTTVAISSNGWLEFGGNTAGNSDPTNDCLPSPAHTNPLLAFFWDDMRTINTAIRYGTVGTAPGRVFIVDADIESNAGSNHDVTLQVQLHEGSNLVTVKYDDTEAESSGQTATIGFQGAGGAAATARSVTCNGKVLDDNTPLDAWSIDLGLVEGTALAGFTLSSTDDIPGGFTTLSGNDALANATIPFPVVIDGVGYTTVAISTNGWLEFGGDTSGNSDPSNDCLPSAAHTNPLLAAYWDDMRTINTAIRYGTLGTAPGRTFVIDYDIENNNAGNNDVQFQVQIHEGSNLVTTKYIASQNEANGQTATLGFQGAGGASATARSVGCNAKVLDDNVPDFGWSIDLGSPRGGALHGVIAHSRDDLPGGFTTLSGNDSVATATLPFTVTLDGIGYTTVALSTNGWLEFGGNTSGGLASHPANTCLPNAAHTNPFLAAYWDDTRTVGSAIRYGTVGTAPGRVFIANFQLENNFGGNHDVIMQVQVHEGSDLITVDYLDSENEANGQTATIGWQGAGGASAQARSIGCNGKVLDDNTARSEGWSIAQLVVCGDGLVGAGEACDLGAANGAATSCCTAACALRAAGQTCRAAAGICDVVETCTGASPTCPPDGFEPASTVCRGAAGVCDVAENCTGSGASCPADGFATGGTCRTGSGDLCDPDETCDGSGAACPADVVAPPSTTCRAAAGVCDVAESCTGVATQPCPADGFESSSAVCRPAAGVCDVAETCTGSGPSCPGDGFATGPICRTGSGDLCDPDESCDGSGPACPADAVAPPSTTCRAAAGVCDVAESCTGVAGQPCPADAFDTGSVCRPGSGDLCDPDETCDGSGAACPPDSVSGAFVVCRPSAGACDVAENCTGTATQPCPGDAVEPASATCRPAAGICDVAENCDGAGVNCPADSVSGAFVVCRPAAGACDLTETCDGSGVDCPSDAKSVAVCRAAAGVCDVAESCDGVGDNCPADALAPATTVCRPSSGACDIAENCTGSSTSCPADTGLPDTDSDTVCDAIDNCDTIPNTPQDNNDTDPLGDACDPCTNIVPTVQDKAKITLTKLLAPAGDDKLTFKSFFTSMPNTPTVDPLVNGARFLIVDSTGAIPVDVTIPGGAYNTANKEGWKVNGSGTSWTYKNAGTIVPLVNGIQKVQIKAISSTPGKYKIGVKGKNGTYPINTANLPLVPTIVIDVPFAAGGQCGEAQFPAIPPAKPSCLAVSAGKTVKCK